MRPVDDQPNEKEATSKSDRQTLAMVAENLQAIQQHLMADSSEHADDLCSETTNHMVNAGKGMLEMEMCPTESELWERGLELSHYEDLTHCQESPVRQSLHLCQCEISVRLPVYLSLMIQPAFSPVSGRL